MGLAITLVACLICTGFSKQISETFIDTSKDISKETLQLAQTLLSISSVGLMIDALKNISAYNLFSIEDALFSSLLNAVSTFMLALPAGAYLSLLYSACVLGLGSRRIVGWSMNTASLQHWSAMP